MSDPAMLAIPDARCVSCGGTPLKVKKQQLCNSCYCRYQRYGDPKGGGPKAGLSEVERFNYYVPDQSDPAACWVWTGPTLGRDVCDYGRLYVGGSGGSRFALAHRWSYEHFIGPIPDGLEIDHVKARGCTSTLCVNPAHLEPVTHKVNVQRGAGVGTVNAAKDRCPKCGGAYEVSTDGKRRSCRSCANARTREWMRGTGRTTGEGQGARNREKTHCAKGHEFTAENTYYHPKTGNRDCKICRGERRNKSAAKIRASTAATADAR